MRFAAPTLALGLLAAALAFSPSTVSGQQRVDVRIPDSTHMQVIRTRDGSTLVGRTIAVWADSVHFQTSGGTLTLRRTDIAEVSEIRSSAMRADGYWPPSPNATRLFFAPTGRMLKKGEGYFSDYYLFFLGVAAGVTDRFTLGGGLSVFPSPDFSDNIVYATPKVGLYSSEKLNVAAGVLVGGTGIEEAGGPFGVAYGVGTLGSPDASLTFGAGFGYADKEWSNQPFLMLGGEKRLSRRTAFVTENYFIPTYSQPIVSYGLRIFGEKISVDLAFFTPLGDDALFPGIPYIDFVVAF